MEKYAKTPSACVELTAQNATRDKHAAQSMEHLHVLTHKLIKKTAARAKIPAPTTNNVLTAHAPLKHLRPKDQMQMLIPHIMHIVIFKLSAICFDCR